ncbi:MAG: hypothetical protein CMQ15_17915 [Gammaproteobacteria bacterium]|nr:hypothetical protein [Gammaproteobacteria bacterium]HJN95154.1 DUF4156 domain-containing protein [Gammaproteobacteria bacterium]|tara:strand:- start:812 stop:1129 length:318 start_codon:yes stop_codon:yes gene_type:complete
MTRFLLIAVTTSLLAACNSWVGVTNEGAGVQLANAAEVGNCRRLGRTQAQTMSRVVVVERGGERMQEELTRLARNEAGSMGGNTIVPESVIDEGRQTFGVYSCPN